MGTQGFWGQRDGLRGGNDIERVAADTSGPTQYGSLTYSQFTSDYYALYTYAAFLFFSISLSLSSLSLRTPSPSFPYVTSPDDPAE